MMWTRKKSNVFAPRLVTAEGTIRNQFGTDIERNAIHGSDAPETAATELRFFFRDLDLAG